MDWQRNLLDDQQTDHKKAEAEAAVVERGRIDSVEEGAV